MMSGPSSRPRCDDLLPRSPQLACRGRKQASFRIRGWPRIVIGGLFTETVQSGAMRRTIDLDSELEAQLVNVVSLTREKPAVVIRQALRAGLSTVANRFQQPRPEGYFDDDYANDKERVTLELAMGKVKQKPER